MVHFIRASINCSKKTVEKKIVTALQQGNKKISEVVERWVGVCGGGGRGGTMGTGSGTQDR